MLPLLILNDNCPCEGIWYLPKRLSTAFEPFKDCPQYPLKMYTNQIDYVIAKSKEEAEKILIEMMYGERAVPRGEFLLENDIPKLFPLPAGRNYFRRNYFPIYMDEIEGEGWEEMPMDSQMDVWEEDTGETHKKTVREWIDEWGEGYFVSTEY